MTAPKLIQFHLWKIVNIDKIYLGLVTAWPGTILKTTDSGCFIIKSENLVLDSRIGRVEVYFTPTTDLVITKLTGNDPPIPITDFLESLQEAEEPIETQ